MKATITKIKLALAVLFVLATPLFVSAADIYVCGTGTVTLAYSGTYTLQTGDRVVWQKVDTDGNPISGSNAIEKTYNGNASDTNLELTGGSGDLASAGEHFYRAHVLTASPSECSGDVSAPSSVYMLPEVTVSLTPGSSTYCEGATPTTVSATTNASSLPTGFTVTLDWTGSTGGAADSGDNTKYNMTATSAGTHTVTVKATLNNATGKTLKSSGSGCDSTDSESITVSPKPAAPIITVS